MVFPFKVVDLTHTLHHDIPTWNGGCGFHHDVHMDYADCQGEDKFCVMKIRMHAGVGTHMDAPSHCHPQDKNVDDFDMNDLIMPSVVIDVSDNIHEYYRVTVDDILDFESQYGQINTNTCVMIRTGWDRFWHDPMQYRNDHKFPSVSIEAAHLLIERHVKALGIDTLSPDRPADGFNVHQAFLGHNKILIENVAHLDQLPPMGSYSAALPMKIAQGTEAPIRLIGLIPF